LNGVKDNEQDRGNNAVYYHILVDWES